MHRALLLVAVALSVRADTLVEKTTFRDESAWRLTDGITEAIIVPSYGGRLMRYGKVGGENWLWNGQPDEPGEYMRWGGDKTFPGPHSMWRFTAKKSWPPPTPDTTEHAVEKTATGILTTSPPWDGYGGARVVREYGFENGDLVIHHRITPAEGSAVPVAVWVITQCEPSVAYIPLPKKSPYKDNVFWFDWSKRGTSGNLISPTLLEIRPTVGEVFKLGAHPERPALAAVRNGVLFLQRTEVEFSVKGEAAPRRGPRDPGAQYPEGADGAGLSVEFYHHNLPPPRHYIELELLSPLRPARKGAALTTRWSLHDIGARPAAEAAAELLQK